MDLTHVHNFDTVESGHTQRNLCNATPICGVNTSMDLRRDGKCSVIFMEMLETQGYERAQERRQREVKEKVHILRCVLLT